MKKNIYHLGFSKCGTSSIWEFWNSFPETKSRCLRTEVGAIEFDLRSHLTQKSEKLLTDGGCYLKFSGAAFSAKAIENTHKLACRYGEPVYLLSVRSPKKALLSWYNMHKKIAREGVNRDHFAVKEMDKYLSITIEDYAKEFIDRVDYSSLIKRFADLVPASSLWILDFRNVSYGVSGVMGNLLEDLYPGIPYPDEFPRRNIGTYPSDLLTLPQQVVDHCDRLESDLNDLLLRPDLLGPMCRLGA